MESFPQDLSAEKYGLREATFLPRREQEKRTWEETEREREIVGQFAAELHFLLSLVFVAERSTTS